MKLLEQLSNLRNRTPRGGGSARVAVVHWDRETIYYLVVSPKSNVLLERDFGGVSHGGAENPLMALADHFRNQSISVQRLVVLLSRPELDIPTLNLPPAEPSELPSLIASEVEQQLGEADEPPIIDFHVIANPKADKNASIQVLAFALPAKELSSLQKQVAGTGFKLAAIGSRHLSPLSILRRQKVTKDSLVVSVHLYAGEVELAVCSGVEPWLLRTIRLSTDEPGRVAEQIWMEMQRCLTLLPQETAELQLSWYVFKSTESATQVATALEELGGSAIHIVDPLSDWKVDLENESAEQIPAARIASAANAGAAWDFVHDSLSINLLAPRRSPQPLHPMVRWGAIGGGGVAVLGIASYFMLSDVWQLQQDVETLQSEVTDSQKLTAKYQEKSDQVAAVQAWLGDQVDWLAELNELSNRLPDGEDATVRRLTASANPNGANIDLAVQVAQQEFISQVESRIRSAKYSATSKQISQNASSAEYPWQFDTKITFPIESQKQNAYVSKSVVKASKAKTEDSKTIASELADVVVEESKSKDELTNSDGESKETTDAAPDGVSLEPEQPL